MNPANISRLYFIRSVQSFCTFKFLGCSNIYFQFFQLFLNLINLFLCLIQIRHPDLVIDYQMSIARTIIYSISIVVQIYKLYQKNKQKSKKVQLVRQVMELIPLSPSQILEKMRKSNVSQSLQICSGKIFASQTCPSFLSQKIKVIYSQLKEGKFAFKNPSPKTINIKQPSFLKMKDNLNSINFYQTHKTIFIPTRKISSKVIDTTIKQKIINFFMGIFELRTKTNILRQLFNQQNVYEVYIPQGAECTVLGKFVKQSTEVCCYEPIIVTSNATKLISHLKNLVINDKILMIVISIGLLLSTSLILRELWAFAKKYRNYYINAAINIRKIFLKSRLCTICHRNLSCMLNKPCMHMLTCNQCVKVHDQCQQCKSSVKQVIQMYVC